MRHKTNRQIFAMPVLLGIATILGLGAGLLGDGGWDAAAGLLLVAPLAVTAWYWRKPPAPRCREPRSRRIASPA